MKKKVCVKMKAALATLSMLLALGISNAEEQKRVEFSGFARAVVGYLDDDNLSFLGYENNYSFGEQSLFAVRADATLTDKISVVVQAIAHTASNRDSGIQWLYLDYRPTKDWSFKLGRQRIPFFSYSDVIDVGFAYPWITPPTQVYTEYVFSEFDGLIGRYDFATKSASGSFEAYVGNYNGDIGVAGRVVNAHVDYIAGVYSTLNIDNLTISAAYHRGKVHIEIPELLAFQNTLRMLSFDISADWLSVGDTPSFLKLGARYDSLDYFVEAEWTKIRAESSFIPKVDSAYITVGYNIAPFSVHATIAHSDSSYRRPLNQIPLGVNPQLDGLHFGFEQIFDSLPLDNLTSFTVGGRYDWQYNIAFKAEVSILKGKENERSFFGIKDRSISEREAVLFQLAAEWVF